MGATSTTRPIWRGTASAIMRSAAASGQDEPMETTLIPVILSGGAGTRLWPLSRELYSKQLLALTGRQTMLQETAARLAGIDGARDPSVVCNEAPRVAGDEPLGPWGRRAGAILLEPVGRNTAPAVALAALQALTIDP